ncbi:MAG: hypothetical protein OEP52_09060, partial [Acidimicrobiia bacterium]|nr:hypothetical protein [Acidimicrobiia bacterium]
GVVVGAAVLLEEEMEGVAGVDVVVDDVTALFDRAAVVGGGGFGLAPVVGGAVAVGPVIVGSGPSV